MKSFTRGLAQTLRRFCSPKQRHDKTNAKYYGKTAYFVLPRLHSGLLTDRVRRFLTNELIITIASTYQDPVIQTLSAVDFHIFGGVAIPELKDSDTIKIATVDWDCPEKSKNILVSSPDIIYPISKQEDLLTTLDFESHSFNNTFHRPEGRDVFLTTGVFLAEHWGCKRIVIFGWDEPLIYDKDRELTASAVTSMLAWFKSKGMDIYHCSQRSTLPVPKISVEDVLCLRHELN